jgi:hypothetical protein
VSVANTGSFTLSAPGITIAKGGEGSLAITVTPSGGYTGTVDITPSSSTASFCYTTTSATVSGTAAVKTSMTIDLTLSDCSASGGQPKSKPLIARIPVHCGGGLQLCGPLPRWPAGLAAAST